MVVKGLTCLSVIPYISDKNDFLGSGLIRHVRYGLSDTHLLPIQGIMS